MPFDEEPARAASNEQPVSRTERFKNAPWRKILLWTALFLTVWAFMSSGPGALAFIPFVVSIWVISWLTMMWLRKDPGMSLKAQVDQPEPATPKKLDKDVTLTLDEEIAFTALVSSMNEEPKSTHFDVVVYKDLLRMPWSKKPKQ